MSDLDYILLAAGVVFLVVAYLIAADKIDPKMF